MGNIGNSNYSLIEGQWKNFTFRKVQPEDADKVIQHIKDYFLHDEPTSKLIGYTDEYGEEFAALIRPLLAEGLSFWVQDNETGEVAAVRITYRHKRDSKFEGFKMNSKALQILFRIVVEVNEGCNLFDHYNIDEYADFFVASCATKYRRQGITSELYRRSLKFLAAEGFKMAKSAFTSPYTRAAAKNLGFEEVYRLNYTDMRDEEGNLVFEKYPLNDEHYCVNLCKVL